MQTPVYIKPAAWGCVIGAAAITIIGFSASWIVSTGSAHAMAENQAEAAVLSALTPICVAQFRAENDDLRAEQLVAMEKLSRWKRGDIVAAQGWATMPGTEDANEDVAEACSNRLLDVADSA